MSEKHFVGIHGAAAEAVHPDFVRDGLLRARERSWDGFRAIREAIQLGMTETEAREKALKVLAEMGASKHWHRPYIRFGPGTALSFHDAVQTDYRLKENDPVYVDIGPVWTDELTGLEYEGDVGDTFVVGSNPAAQRCAEAAREIFTNAQKMWREHNLEGTELYNLLKAQAKEHGFDLLERVDGHRLGDYPHTKYSKERLAKVTFTPNACLWVLEVQLLEPNRKFGAFYEDLLM